ncbi:copper resistance protein B [Caulobacter segnis]
MAGGGRRGATPHWFDVQLTGYIGSGGRLAARAKLSNELRFTNRLIPTPQAETNLYSKRSERRTLGAGLSNLELSLRLRYEFSCKVAPHVGVVWERSFGGTANFHRAEGDPVSEHRIVAGLRLWPGGFGGPSSLRTACAFGRDGPAESRPLLRPDGKPGRLPGPPGREA